MKSIPFALTSAVLATTVFAASLEAQRSTGDSFTWQAAMNSGATLVIRNINGPVSVQRATGGQAEVVAEKKYTRGDPSRVVIEAVRYGARNENAVVCALWDPAARCNEGGTNTTGRTTDNSTSDIAVNFTVKLPVGVNAQLHTINGRIDVTGATSAVDASTINGAVSVAGAGPISASSVSGNVEATISSASGDADIELKTVNGSVTATAPAGLNAMLNASTINGSIESDFPLTVQGRFGMMRSVNATLGSGGRKLSMTTINGSVTLKRS